MLHDRLTRVPSRLAVVVALVVMALAAVSLVSTPTAHAQGSVYYVEPDATKGGKDTNPGTAAAPLLTLQKALDLAQPGTTINLRPGRYRQAVITKRAGTAAAPITIKGPETGKAPGGRGQAVLYGTGGRVFSIDHSYYTLDGFTIDGQEKIDRAKYQGITSLSQVSGFKDSVQGDVANSKLIYVGATDTTRDIVGTTISNMFLTGSGGECVRFRNRAANSLVVNSVIQWCGMRASGTGDQYRYHNAEGVYIGTSPKSTTQPLYANDTSNNIVVRESVINTFGSECFEVKENAHHNRLENSDCGFNDEPLANQGSNVELRGDHNTVFNSRLTESRSWNLKLASDSSAYDRGGNTAQRTSFKNAAAPAIVNKQSGSGPFCGNTFTGKVSEGNSIGNPTVACVDSTKPTAPANVVAKANSATAVALTWTAATDDVGVTSYSVLRNGSQVGTTATASYTDSGLTASTAYSYTVVARDAAGNASPASSAASVTTPAATSPPTPPTTPPTTPQVINAEAESGTVVSPMAKRTDSAGAQGGTHVTQVSGSGTGRVEITVNVPTAGRYAFAGRVLAPNSSSDSFTYKIGNGTTTTWNLGTRTSWAWVTGPTVTLPAGQLKIVISKRENGARLDAVRLTPVA